MEALPTSAAGPVVLDIGGEMGAAVVEGPAWAEGAEIEIRRLGLAWDGRHASVRARYVAGGQVHAAVFGPLEHGRWQARWRPGDASGPVCSFEVEGGRVTRVRLNR
jgi:hypothetical protein